MGKRLGSLIGAFALIILISTPAHSAEPNWQNAFGGNPDPLAQKLLMWLNVTETDAPSDSGELIHFTLENYGWPKLHVFRERIEKDIGPSSQHPYEIAAWFDQNAPKSAGGFNAYMAAIQSLGQYEKAKTALRKFWLDAELDKRDTAALAAQYRRLFLPTDHIDRLDSLLWEQRYQEAEYMLPLVDADHRKLAEARKALGRVSSKASGLVRAVPASLANDEGLLYDRLRWRRQMNKDKDAVALLHHMPKNTVYPELWWKERNILARRALEKKNYAGAYKIVAGHGLTSGGDYSQAEWMLGWLSLRFLHQPDVAYRHFDNFYQAVTSAVSRSRAAYWLARAAETMQQKESAQNWYKLSAQFPSTFYGQLSHEKLKSQIDAAQFIDDEVPPEAQQAFESTELVQVVRLLAHAGLEKYADPFYIKLLNKASARTDFVLIARLARETDRTRYSVEANKQMQQKIGGFMFTEGYPLFPSMPIDNPESALIHAIVHRESMFDAEAASPAGARGLMQLMPRTAQHISKNMGKKFTVDKLTDNPEYNVELGAAYLQSLLDKYDGYYPFAIAAYNAGPSNVHQWIKEFGDPRNGKVDIIDWIEQIPIYETRNYVQRVMESYYMYKLRLSEEPRTVLAFKSE
jgi:soluble lytic murein transglycosylase